MCSKVRVIAPTIEYSSSSRGAAAGRGFMTNRSRSGSQRISRTPAANGSRASARSALRSSVTCPGAYLRTPDNSRRLRHPHFQRDPFNVS